MTCALCDQPVYKDADLCERHLREWAGNLASDLVQAGESESGSKPKFCDFCACEDCVNGRKDLTHAPTQDGHWICDVCYMYEVCIDAKRAVGVREGPCKDKNCEHRPKLKDDFRK